MYFENVNTYFKNVITYLKKYDSIYVFKFQFGEPYLINCTHYS